MRILFLTAILGSFISAPLNAALTFSFSPDEDGFTAVTIFGNGSLGNGGSYSSTAASLGNVTGNPADGPWDGTGSAPYLLGINSAAIQVNGQSFNLNFAFIEDDNADVGPGVGQDDFVFQFTNLESLSSGSYTASGAARLLDTQNTFGNGVNAPIPFQALTPGTYTDPTDAQSIFFGGVNIEITTTPITLVPEPSSSVLICLSLLGVTLRRRRSV